MGSVLSWFYGAMESIDIWMTGVWRELVQLETQHPVILAIATLIVLSLFISLICTMLQCLYAVCCERSRKYPRYYAQQLPMQVHHNYAAIPSQNQPPYNPETKNQPPYNPQATDQPSTSQKQSEYSKIV